MISYSIKAHPTLFQGRQYRSRLEARWAAFFTLIGWPFEYEPFDLGAWSPDFLLKGAKTPILCEVKPIDCFDEDVGKKMVRAANASEFRGELLLLGLSPFSIGWKWEESSYRFGNYGWLGWLNDSQNPWFQRSEDWPIPDFIDDFSPCGMVGLDLPDNIKIDFCHPEDSFMGRISGVWDGDHHCGCRNSFELHRLWESAANLVQWTPRK